MRLYADGKSFVSLAVVVKDKIYKGGKAMSHFVIVGASHAGISFAEKLRQQGCEDEITIIDKIAGFPLQRPPLSKAFLGADHSEEEGFYLRAEEWFETQNITLRDGVGVTSIERAAKQVVLGDGSRVSYDKLILATGATARRLPFAEMDCKNVFVLRDGDDAKGLKAAMVQAKNAVVIGGGYIGLEAAASMRKHGLSVHVIEAAPRLLARVASPEISQVYKTLHESHGVQLHIGNGVSGLKADDGAISAVILDDGEEIGCDLLLVGIGVAPEISLAEQAGLAVGNGILTDYDYATTDGDIFAIGDNVLAEGRGAIRIESIHNAQYGGHYLASHFTGAAKPQDEAPWFWSDQYDRKLQSAGLVPPPADDVRQIMRLGKREGGCSVWSFEAGQLRAVESINDPQAYMIGKICLEKGNDVPMSAIEDPDFELKTLR